MAKEQIALRADWDLRSKVYLFKQVGANNYAPGCLISCHGWYNRANFNLYTPPQNTILHFYVSHDETLDDLNNCREILSGAVRPKRGEDVIAPNTCIDYTLGKLQDGRTAISELAEELKMPYADAEEILTTSGETYRGLRAVNSVNLDIATVRNKFGSSTVKLSSVISAIEREHHYNDIYCAFCREPK